jgi:hypothetical protein
MKILSILLEQKIKEVQFMWERKYYEAMKKIEKTEYFKNCIVYLFYGSTFFTLITLFSSWIPFFFYILFWIVFITLYGLLFIKETIPNTIKDFINIIDGPVDKIKEKIHCMNLPFGYQLNISFLMRNRKTTWDIIRKQGRYENCDPEDY